LIPIFFINVGIGFDLDAFREPGVLRETAVLIVLAVLVKALPALLLLIRRHTVRETLAAGTLLSVRLSLIIAVAELGVRLDLIDRSLEASIIVLAMVTTTVAPILFRLLAPPLPGRNRSSEGAPSPAKGS
jgi:Kef-type K+ transport system membrane component KefB